MDLASILHVDALATGAGCAAGVLALAGAGEFLLGGKKAWKVLSPALMPLALGAGFVAHHAVAFEFPKAADGRPWYLDEMWKMPVLGVLAGVPLVAIARIAPRWLGIVPLVLAAVAASLLCVRGPWRISEEVAAWPLWGAYACGLAGAILVYCACAWPIWRERGLWGAGVGPMWVSLSAAAVVLLSNFDQQLGRMLVMGAILAGIAGVAAIVPRLRPMVGAGVPALAIILAAVGNFGWYSDLTYTDPPVVRRALWLLASAPLGMAIAWIPAMRKRPWTCSVLATAISCAIAAAGMAIAIMNAPAPME